MEKHSKRLARTSIVSSIVAIIAILTWLIKGVGGYVLSANQLEENTQRIKKNDPVINKLCTDIEVIKNDTSWIKDYLKSNK